MSVVILEQCLAPQSSFVRYEILVIEVEDAVD